MAFCIPASEYDETIHNIIAGPSPQCPGCELTQSFGSGSYSNISFGQGAGLMANSLPETLSFYVKNQSVESSLLTRSSGKYMMATARRGSKRYNNGLEFYLDPDSISFTDNPWIRYDLLPSDIDNAFLSSGIQSMEVCFDISGAEIMEVTGVQYCNGNFDLSWEADKQLVGSKHVQCGICLGGCPAGYEKTGDGTYETCVKVVTPSTYSEEDVQNRLEDIEREVSELGITATLDEAVLEVLRITGGQDLLDLMADIKEVKDREAAS